ncbi:hypothetical protein OF83DRAFT_473062 [Amylostereum chailletii]|nr:hypothetical protein OF83DRAFT_473062 [Amylostereum chailletii]
MLCFPTLLNIFYDAIRLVACTVCSIGSIIAGTIEPAIVFVIDSDPWTVFIAVVLLALCTAFSLIVEGVEEWDVIPDRHIPYNNRMHAIESPPSRIHSYSSIGVSSSHGARCLRRTRPSSPEREVPPPWRNESWDVRPVRPRPTAVSFLSSHQTTYLPQHPIPRVPTPDSLPSIVTSASNYRRGAPTSVPSSPSCIFFNRRRPYARCFIVLDPSSSLLVDPNPNLCAKPEVGDLLMCGTVKGQVNVDHLDKMRVFDVDRVWRNIRLGDPHPTEGIKLNRPPLDRLTWVKDWRPLWCSWLGGKAENV